MEHSVAVWGTGNMGATAIRSVVGFPGLRLSAVITSTPEKAGRDAASFAGLASDAGVAATLDVDSALSVSDAVAYMASGDIRADEAAADVERCLRAGLHVVTPALSIVVRADLPGGSRADGGNTTAANRLLGAISWLAEQKPGIYDGLDVPLRQEREPAVEAQRWHDAVSDTA